MEWLEVGYWGLFVATFLAATILPFSSEAIFTTMILAGFDPLECLVISTAGNTLGGMSSYGIGYLGNLDKSRKWLRIEPKAIIRWQKKIETYGPPFALLCWTPVVGDVIAVALGVFRSKPWPVAFFMLIGKFGRYAVLYAILV